MPLSQAPTQEIATARDDSLVEEEPKQTTAPRARQGQAEATAAKVALVNAENQRAQTQRSVDTASPQANSRKLNPQGDAASDKKGGEHGSLVLWFIGAALLTTGLARLASVQIETRFVSVFYVLALTQVLASFMLIGKQTLSRIGFGCGAACLIVAVSKDASVQLVSPLQYIALAGSGILLYLGLPRTSQD